MSGARLGPGLRRPFDQLVEIALLPAAGGVLHDQGKIVLIELLEPIVPANLLQSVFAAVARKIEPDHADVTFSARLLHARWDGAALFGPRSNLFVIRQFAIRAAGGTAARAGAAALSCPAAAPALTAAPRCFLGCHVISSSEPSGYFFFLAEPGSDIWRCCDATMGSGSAWPAAAWSLFLNEPATT